MRDNFIGSLPQQNSHYDAWTDFYIANRLLPQFVLAVDTGRLGASDFPSEDKLHTVLSELFEGIRPSLLHGDLWGGNYLISSDGIPYLIDPAVYDGHSEVDLAMSRLFGGFGSRFYAAYHEVIPSQKGSEERNAVYQLYYLLVHLNLFGASYYPSVMQILKRLA